MKNMFKNLFLVVALFSGAQMMAMDGLATVIVEDVAVAPLTDAIRKIIDGGDIEVIEDACTVLEARLGDVVRNAAIRVNPKNLLKRLERMGDLGEFLSMIVDDAKRACATMEKMQIVLAKRDEVAEALRLRQAAAEEQQKALARKEETLRILENAKREEEALALAERSRELVLAGDLKKCEHDDERLRQEAAKKQAELATRLAEGRTRAIEERMRTARAGIAETEQTFAAV